MLEWLKLRGRGAALVCAGGMAFPTAVPGEAPVSLVLEGVPPLREDLPGEVARFTQFSTALFQDWHPRRREVLFLRREGLVPELLELGRPGGVPRRLTNSGDPVFSGLYSRPEGEGVVFLRDDAGNECYQLYGRAGNRGPEMLLTDGRSRNSDPRPAPASGRIAYTSNRRNGRDADLYLVDPDRPGSDRCLLQLSGGGGSVLDWSPDERHLLIREYQSPRRSLLHQVEVATGDRRLLTPGDGAFLDGRFLPDGSGVLVITDLGGEYREVLRGKGSGDSWERVSVDGGRGDVESFDVATSDGSWVYARNEGGYSVLYAGMPGGHGPVRRLEGIPRGVAGDVRVHPSGREVAFSLASARLPGEVYSVDLRRGSVAKWTGSRVGEGRYRRFAEPELVGVAGFDGIPLQGFLYRPDPRRFPGPRPVLISLHGGPELQSRPGFLGRWNYLLERMGVALLMPNVRGSSGYGKTFMTLDDGRLREDAVRDVGAFLDWVGRDERLDPSRVALHGASYGGYLVLAALAEWGARIRCGIDVAGITSFPAFLRSTEESRRDLRREEYGDEADPEMAEFLWRLSPLSRAERIRTPLLVAQGLTDPRVPAGESANLVRALRAQGTPVSVILARDEGHGFARKPNADFLFLSMVQFLESHLLVPDPVESDPRNATP